MGQYQKCDRFVPCTEKVDYVYGIAGILNLNIPNNLELEDAMTEMEYCLQKQGIFMAEECVGGVYSDHYVLCTLYINRSPIDGITILGRVDDITQLGFSLDDDVDIIGHGEYGKIIFKSKHTHDDERYRHIGYKYETTKTSIYLETNRYNNGDILETTEIGRKGCTFERRGSHEVEILEINGNKVKTVGYISGDLDDFKNEE
jgi:hypothetical protein